MINGYLEDQNQGVLHNPRNDRRTTANIFHIAKGGLPIPDDKKAVPRDVSARILAAALNAPADLLTLPWISTRPDPARCFISLLLRPVVVPEVPGVTGERCMEIRFIAPGGLVFNLDFVEGIVLVHGLVGYFLRIEGIRGQRETLLFL